MARERESSAFDDPGIVDDRAPADDELEVADDDLVEGPPQLAGVALRERARVVRDRDGLPDRQKPPPDPAEDHSSSRIAASSGSRTLDLEIHPQHAHGRVGRQTRGVLLGHDGAGRERTQAAVIADRAEAAHLEPEP